jgi:hypothetical protein
VLRGRGDRAQVVSDESAVDEHDGDTTARPIGNAFDPDRSA